MFENKKYTTAAIAIALGLSEASIHAMYNNAKELAFSQIIEIATNPKMKRYDEETAELKEKLSGLAALFGGK